MVKTEDFKLRKVNNEFVLVPTGEASKRFSGEIKLNETAAFVWERLELSEEEIATELSKQYGISPQKAEKDTENAIEYFESIGVLFGDSEQNIKADGNLKIEDVLEKEGVFISTTVGISMYPLLKNRRDNVVLEKPKGRLKKYDVPLYKRDEKYILHRIVKVEENSYVTCGDNCREKESGITDGDVLAVATGFYRKNKFVSVQNPVYKAYSVIWVAIYPFRMLWKKIRKFLGRVKRKIKRILIR